MASVRKKQLASDIIMNERLLCGGEQKPSHQIQAELIAEGNDARLVDWYLFCLANHQPCEREGEPDEPIR